MEILHYWPSKTAADSSSVFGFSQAIFAASETKLVRSSLPLKIIYPSVLVIILMLHTFNNFITNVCEFCNESTHKML